MMSYLKHPYISPFVKVVSLDAFAPILQSSIDFFNEDPKTGEPIGDDE